MGNALKAKIKQQADFGCPVAEAMLNLMAASDTVRRQLEQTFAVHNITSAQYNVLRILRGAGSDGHPRCEIAARMIERAPDITRLIDRLEKQEFVMRDSSAADRRFSFAVITPKGLDLLNRIEPELLQVKQQIAQKMSTVEWIALTSLCEKIYVEPGGSSS